MIDQITTQNVKQKYKSNPFLKNDIKFLKIKLNNSFRI